MVVLKNLMAKYIIYQKVLSNSNVIVNGKNFYHQSIDSDIKQCEEKRKITTGQGEDYNSRCFLEYILQDISYNTHYFL